MQQDAVAKAINILERLDELGVLDSMQSLLSDEELRRLIGSSLNMIGSLSKLLSVINKIDWDKVIALLTSMKGNELENISEFIGLINGIDTARLRAALQIINSDVGPVSLSRLVGELRREETRRAIYKSLLILRILLGDGSRFRA
ncbi:MAG: hypothetical protein RXN93_05605 [Thermocladium sp.]